MSAGTPTGPGFGNTVPGLYDEPLRLLSVFHYVWGAIVGVIALLALFQVGMGGAMMGSPGAFCGPGPHGYPECPPPFVGRMFFGMGVFLLLLGESLAALHILTGRFISQRRNRMFCLVVAGLACFSFPFGTILGIFTLVYLTRPQVAEQFASRSVAS